LAGARRGGDRPLAAPPLSLRRPPRLPRLPRLPVAVLLAGSLVAAAARGAGTVILAFGDETTSGVGDDPQRPERGYPPRLEALLRARNLDVEVRSLGADDETTAEGLSRLPRVVTADADVLLLMEGTADVTTRVSLETTVFNLEEMARLAEAAGVEVLHSTVIPRLPTANVDGGNTATGRLAAELREVAWAQDRALADPFEVFLYYTPEVFARYYVGGNDRLHPNPAGHQLLAEVLFDTLVGADDLPPVPGRLLPPDGAHDVPADAEVSLLVYDFGDGINLGSVRLLVDGAPVESTLRGDNSRLDLRYRPATQWHGQVTIGVRAQDLAVPPNAVERAVGAFLVAGATFLRGDLDRDGRVDGHDLVALALRFGARRNESRYRAFADLDESGVVDGADLAILAADFGKTSR